MCGIAGIYSHKPVAAELYDSIIHLQHRGQDAAGIMTYDERMHKEKGMGLAREIFTPQKFIGFACPPASLFPSNNLTLDPLLDNR